MPNNNPDGYNAFGGPVEREMPYGEIAKLQNLTRLAPTAQRVSVIEKRAPKRRKSNAKRQASPQPVVPPTQAEVPYEQILSSFWSELASEPGASPLIVELAEAARRGG